MSAGDESTPPDPAGTQPKVDRDALLPARIEPQPEAERDDGPPTPPAPLPEPIEGHPVGEAHVLHEAPHAARFQFILGALLAIGAIAIFSLIWAVGQNGGDDGPQWSPWKPADRGVEGASEIAAHVTPQYKVNGKQMVTMEASELELANVELKLVRRENAAEGGEILQLDGDAVLFQVSGLGKRGALVGKPSGERGMLLGREIIEVAGYALKYLPEFEYAAFFMPPARTKVNTGTREETVMLNNQMLLFGRGDLGPVLKTPLRATFKNPPPSVQGIKTAPELPLIDALARQGKFYYSLSQSQSDEEAYLVLDREPQPEQIQAAAQQAALEEQQAALEKVMERATKSKSSSRSKTSTTSGGGDN